MMPQERELKSLLMLFKVQIIIQLDGMAHTCRGDFILLNCKLGTVRKS